MPTLVPATVAVGRLKMRDLTSRDWTTRHHYRKGGHRKTCFSVRVDGHYKFMFATGSIIIELLIGFMFLVLLISVLVIPIRSAD